jgi:chromosome segregation ATPase
VGKQNDIISANELKRRQEALSQAEGALATIKTQIEECKATRSAAEKAVHAADEARKAAQKDAKAASVIAARLSNKKASLEGALENEFASLMSQQSASAATKKAVQKLVAIGKEFGLGGTLLQTLPSASKKAAESRTEFEGMVFNQFKALIEGQITSHSAQAAEAETDKAAKDGAVAEADAALQNAKDALAAAEKALSDKQAERTAAGKEVTKADHHLRHIWEDMRKACDEQDKLAAEVQRFETEIWAAFNTLKEHEAPVPEPEPVAEEAAAEEAAPAAAAE